MLLILEPTRTTHELSNMHYRPRSTRVLAWVTGLALILAILTSASCSRRSMTAMFFGVNVDPVEINLKETFSPREADDQTRSMVKSATDFLESLGDEQRQAAVYGFNDNAQRSNWSNLPEGMIPRGGVKLGELSPNQRELLDAFLAEVLSEKGVENLNHQLAAEDTIDSGWLFKYGTQHYYAAFLGEPSTTQPWMFQFGGHHLAINVTVYGRDVSFSPMLTGGQPIHFRYGGKEVSIAQDEIVAAAALMDSLDDDQARVAILGDEPIKLLSGPGEYGKEIPREGIKGSALTNTQKSLLVDVIDARISFLNQDDKSGIMETIRAELDETYFGWWGPRDTPEFSYFRVTGPSIVMEYAPRGDNGEHQIEHVHSMYRNPQNDYGVAWVGQ